MKKISLLITILLCGSMVVGCSKEVEKSLDSSDKSLLDVAQKLDTGNGSFEILSNPINVKDNKLDIVTSGIDENKVTYVYVANKEVLKQKIKNNQNYTLDISSIEEAHSVNYQPKVQLVQYENDDDNKDFTTFKQKRYTVEK